MTDDKHPVADRALTFRQPWAWLIVSGRKTVENRSWKPAGVPMRLAVHAGLRRDAYEGDVGELIHGAIIGAVTVVNVHPAKNCECTEFSKDFDGFHWVLEDPAMFEDPIPAKGRLGLWPCQLPRLQ